MKKRHILFISSWYPSRMDPFNGDFVQRHAKAVSQMHKVSVLHSEGDFNIDIWEYRKVQHTENMTEHYFYFPKSKFPVLNFINKVRGLVKGYRQIKKVDIIHANVVHYHFLWLLFQKVPYVITEHATHYLRLEKLKNYWLKKIGFKLIFKNAFKVLPVSKSLGNHLEKHFGKLDIEVVPNVIDTRRFYPNEEKNSVYAFLHVSNLGPVKNIQSILEAILVLKNADYQFNFRIGGNGDLKLIYEFVKEHDLVDTIHILSSLSHDEVADEMRRSNCFVLFSDFENQPCVIAEAFASGIPIISTDVGGVSEFLPKGFGKLIAKGSKMELIDAMKAMIDSKNEVDAASLNQYAKDQFSEESIAQKFNKIYKLSEASQSKN